MQVLIISPNKAAHKHWTLTKMHALVAGMLCLMIFAYTVVFVSQHIVKSPSLVTSNNGNLPLSSEHKLQVQSIENESEVANVEIPELYAKRLGALQAESIRLKVITKQLANMTGLDLSDYVIDSEPAQGGIKPGGVALTDSEFNLNLAYLSDTFNEQLHQLEVMQAYVVTNNAIASTIPSRRPIDTGWLSSHYGKRVDPFDGKMAFHHGIDFAGKDGDAIYAVADGIVSWTGNKSGYGKTIEIDHGNGYVTRYAHSKELLVSLGDIVSKDQEIALMGSTGRSTGPHVHFELLVAGHKVNPAKFTRN